MFTRQAIPVLILAVCLGFSQPAEALIGGSSTASNCTIEGGNWLDITFSSPDPITLVSIEWDFSNTGVWLDWDGDYVCSPANDGNIGYSVFYENGEGNNCQVFGADFTSFNSGDYFRVACDLDLGGTGCPLSANYEGGVVTVTFSDGTILSTVFDEYYDYPSGSTADFSQSLLDLPNFTFVEDAPWTYPCVPGSTGDATWEDAPVPASLMGDVEQTWFNASVTNDGGATAQPSGMAVYLDGGIVTSHNLWTILPGNRNGWVNDGPYTVRAGRHTLRVKADTGNAVVEFDETDNSYTRQWAWQPPVIGGSTLTRSAPPAHDAGFSYLVNPIYPNCDGLRLQTDSTRPWTALWIEALTDDPVDYQARLHPASPGVEDGFKGIYTDSGNSETTRAVLLNARNINPFLTLFDVGVVNYTGASATADYRAGCVRNSPYPFGFDQVNTSPVYGVRLVSFEFYVGSGDLGPASLVFEVNPEYGPVHAGWLSPDFQYGSLEDLNDPVTTDEFGVAVINLDLQETGYYCAYAYCNRGEHQNNLGVLANIRHGLPDLEPSTTLGWYAPIVPQAHDESLLFSCPLPDTLRGNQNATWLNMACRNQGSASTSTVSFGLRRDGVSLVGISNQVEVLDPGGMRQVRNFCYPTILPFNIPGGRHTLTMELDYLDAVDELSDVNNYSGRQYCWSPAEIPVNGTLARVAVPDRTGGWDLCETGQDLYWNCDGLRMQYQTPVSHLSLTGYWRGVAAMPSSTTRDVDLQLHPPLEGSMDGFGGEVLADSESDPGEIEFVLVSYRRATAKPHDVGVLDGPTNNQAGYLAQDAVSTGMEIDGSMEYTGTVMAAGRMLDLYDIVFTEAGYWTITLEDGGGGVDWGLSLYGPNNAYLGKAETVDSGFAQEGGAAASESITVFMPAMFRHCLAVWKVGSEDLDTTAPYSLKFWDGISAAPEPDLPRTACLRGAAPNPFNPRTMVSFALPEDGPCRLKLVDIAGKHVRTLVQGQLSAGAHEIPWDGTDDSGRRVASGAYVAILEAGHTADRMKITLLK